MQLAHFPYHRQRSLPRLAAVSRCHLGMGASSAVESSIGVSAMSSSVSMTGSSLGPPAQTPVLDAIPGGELEARRWRVGSVPVDDWLPTFESSARFDSQGCLHSGRWIRGHAPGCRRFQSFSGDFSRHRMTGASSFSECAPDGGPFSD